MIFQKDLPFTGELQSVVYKIGDHLHQTFLVGIDTVIGQVGSQQNRYSLVFLYIIVAHHVLTEVTDIHIPHIIIKCSRFYLCQIQNVGYQLQEQFRILLHDGKVFLAFFPIVQFGNDACKTDNGIERSTDFMTHIGQKSRLQAVQMFCLILGDPQFLLYLFLMVDIHTGNDMRHLLVHPSKGCTEHAKPTLVKWPLIIPRIDFGGVSVFIYQMPLWAELTLPRLVRVEGLPAFFPPEMLDTAIWFHHRPIGIQHIVGIERVDVNINAHIIHDTA